VWDFRSADMQAGGQGAPLVPFFHHALARRMGRDRPLAFLNIGGVANVTWIDPAVPKPELSGALLAFDTGPGNALINDLVQSRLGVAFDHDGALARTGRADAALVERWTERPFFSASPPKSLDRDYFAAAADDLADKTTADAAATLTEFTARTIALAFGHFPKPVSDVLVSGGGARNGWLMARLNQLLPVPIAAAGAADFDGDMLEAQAFGWLAARVVRKLPTSAPATTGCRIPVCGGRISG
jgi:anhydro-N-acetylmuramic acid kinase